MNILEFCKIIGAEIRISSEVKSDGGSWVNVDLRRDYEDARTVDDGPLCGYGRDQQDIPDVNEAGIAMVMGFRGRKIGFTGGLVKPDTFTCDVPEDLEWGIKIGAHYHGDEPAQPEFTDEEMAYLVKQWRNVNEFRSPHWQSIKRKLGIPDR